MRALLLVLGLCCGMLAQAEQAPPKSARQAIVVGQQMVDAGELESAVPYLQTAVKQFPENDTLIAIYGQALYESRRIQEAEAVFRQALVINPLNKVAKSYVEDIRETSAASVSLQYQKIVEVFQDKVGDVIVMALAFFLGSVLGGYWNKFQARRFVAKSRRLFMKGEYDDFADLMEIQLSRDELRPLRDSLGFMLDHKTEQETIDILEKYVNSEDNLATLKRMVRLSAGSAHGT